MGRSGNSSPDPRGGPDRARGGGTARALRLKATRGGAAVPPVAGGQRDPGRPVQVRAGITNADVVPIRAVRSPPGAAHRILFYLTETDQGADVILLSGSPRAISSARVTPDGTLSIPPLVAARSDIDVWQWAFERNRLAVKGETNRPCVRHWRSSRPPRVSSPSWLRALRFRSGFRGSATRWIGIMSS
jgi:hypothetical protein